MINETTVKLRPGESQESLLKRFRKEVGKARILSDVRKKRWFMSKSELRRKKRSRASEGLAVLRIGSGKRISSILEQIVFSKLPEQRVVI